MTKSQRLGSAACLLLLLCASPLLAQTTPRPTSPAPGSSTRPANQRGGQERCLQQAGVSQQVMEQHRQISENARSQISVVCGDSSLSAQQKHQKIQEIHQQARQQMEGLFSAQQRQAVEACRQKQGGGGGGHHGGMAGHRSGEGPCGELPSARGGQPLEGSDLDQN